MEEIRIPVRFEGRILADAPADTGPPGQTVAVLTLHGYGSSPEAMLRLTRMTVGDQCPILAMQGPFQHYAGAPGGDAGYNWGIRQHHADAVRLHHEMVRRAIELVEQRFGVPGGRTLLMGFSQPVGLNYRFIGTHPGAVGGVAAICGGVPKDWETGAYGEVATPILHIARDADEFFPAAVASQFPTRLAARAKDVEFHMLPGTHRYPSKARGIFAAWMDRVFA